MRDEEERKILLSRSKKLHEDLKPYATKGYFGRRREAAIRCLERYGSAKTLAEKLHIDNKEYGNAEGMNQFDALSRLGFAVVSKEVQWQNFENNQWIIKQILSYEGAPFILLGGRLETGKTDMAILLAEIGLEKGVKEKIATNIKSAKSET